jgi:hypothetical protein
MDNSTKYGLVKQAINPGLLKTIAGGALGAAGLGYGAYRAKGLTGRSPTNIERREEIPQPGEQLHLPRWMQPHPITTGWTDPDFLKNHQPSPPKPALTRSQVRDRQRTMLTSLAHQNMGGSHRDLSPVEAY